jgi:hypothetical protein
MKQARTWPFTDGEPMSSDGDGNENISQDPESGKEQMVAFLTSTGKIRPHVASSLFDQGLDDRSKLRIMEREGLLKYHGVGEKTADALLELRDKAQASAPAGSALWDQLKKGKVNAKVAQSLMDAGLVTPMGIREAGKEGLMKIKGIGAITADRILGSVKDMPELARSPIEDASAVSAPEEAPAPAPEQPKGQGIMEKVASFFKGLFGKKAETEKPSGSTPSEAITSAAPSAEVPSAPAEPAETSTESPTEPPSAAEAEPKPDEVPTKVGEAAPAADRKDGVEVSDAPLTVPMAQASPDRQEPPGEEKTAEEAKPEQPVTSAQASTAPEQPKQGFFGRIFSVFKKAPAPAAPAAPAGEAAKDQETPKGPVGPAQPQPGPETSPPAGSGQTISQIGSLEEIPGIDAEVIRRLKEASYNSVDELREAIPEDLTLIQGIDIETARRICDAIKLP